MSTNLMYTSWFATNYTSFSTSVEVGIKVYCQNPPFSDNYQTSVFSGITSITQLDAKADWVESPVSLTTTVDSIGLKSFDLTASIKGFQLVNLANDAVLSVEGSDGWVFPTNTQVTISSIVIYAKNITGKPVLFATTEGIGDGTVVVHGGSIYGQSSAAVTISGTQYLVKRDSATSTISIGYSYLKLAIPEWESPHTQHVWIQPQRTNFIINPSFENLSKGKYGWSTGVVGTGAASLTSVTGGVDSIRTKCGYVSTSPDFSGIAVLESNLFPSVSPWYSVSFHISSTSASDINFGLVAHDYSGTSNTFIVAAEKTISGGGSATSGFVQMYALVKGINDTKHYSLRIESTGGEFWVDNMLVDPHEGQYEYFDGNSINTIDGDYRWMGGTSNSHFSLWYNNFKNSKARLVGNYDDADNTYKGSLYQEWSPAGASVVTHWDAVTSFTPLNWVGDAFYPVKDASNTAISVITTMVEEDTFLLTEDGDSLITESGEYLISDLVENNSVDSVYNVYAVTENEEFLVTEANELLLF